MGKVFRNKKEIPIPMEAFIDKGDGRVFVKRKDSDGAFRRCSIGYAASEVTMYPNESFKALYPDLWETYYGKAELRPYELSMGLYALALGIATESTLYVILQNVYGPLYANALLDYAMYSIADRSDTPQLFSARMEDEVRFSQQLYSENWYEALFKELSKEQHHEMNMQWVQHCKSKGMTMAWISIDGSNDDGEAGKKALSDAGELESDSENKCIVGYMYAVNAEDGTPIAYLVYEGSTPDCKAFHQMACLLKSADIKIEGVILDRDFCTNDVIQTLRECELDYIIMMRQDNLGHMSMLEEYGAQLPWNPEYVVSDDGVFGIVDTKKLFKWSEAEDYVNLYYDDEKGNREAGALISMISTEKRKITQMITEGNVPTLSAGMDKYLELINDNGSWSVDYRSDNCKKDMAQTGFFSLLSHKNYGAEKALQVYHLRDTSAAQYRVLKSQEGYHTGRVCSKPGINSKFAAAFIASIIRNEVLQACKQLGYDTNEFICDMDRIRLLRVTDNHYVYAKRHSQAQLKLLARFGIDKDTLSLMADDFNHRMNSPMDSQVRAIPVPKNVPTQKKKRGCASSVHDRQREI